MGDMAPDHFAEALDFALAMIAKRERSEHEVRTGLLRKGFDEDAVQVVIDRLRARNILNDTRFADARIQSRSAKGFGLDRIRLELAATGVELQSSEAVYPDQAQLIQAILLDRIAKKPATNRASAGRFLTARGFSEDLVESALESAFGTSDSSPE
jgi:regulatory protein